MKKVFQTIHGESGNCLAACLCSILELDIKDVPNFCEKGNGWFQDCNNFLRKFNLGLLAIDHNVISRTQSDYDYHYIVQGKSPRGFYHAVVYHKNKMVHDPHPSGLGLTDFNDVIVLARRDGVIK
ncbi:MAG: hypothetical protein WC976_06800 [Caldisericia bacterium]